MMFCSFWNDDYGDHFSGEINKTDRAYHGPVAMEPAELKSLLEVSSVREIVEKLRCEAVRQPGFKQFNHQNAWSREDMVSLLTSHGFNVVSMNKSEILSCFKHVKAIDHMCDWSMFVLAELSGDQEISEFEKS